MRLKQYLPSFLSGGQSQAEGPDTEGRDFGSNQAQQQELDGKPQPTGRAGVYVVQQGDTLGGIARLGTGDPMDYRTVNAFNEREAEDSAIAPGDVLAIPQGWDFQAIGATEESDPAYVALVGELLSGAPDPEKVREHWEACEADSREKIFQDAAISGMLQDSLSVGQQQPGGLTGLLAAVAGMAMDAGAEVMAQGMAARDEVSSRLSQALSAGYSRFFGTSGQEADKGPQSPEEAEAQQAPQPEGRAWEDGFDEVAAQAHIDEVIEGYMDLEVGGMDVGTRYRNTSSQSGYHDPVYGGLAEPQMYKEHPELYFAIMGKASPAQLEAAFSEAVDAGVIHASVGKSPDQALTSTEIEEWGHKHFGVDCIGLVMNTLLSSDDYADFVPENTDGTDFQRYMNVNTHDFEAASEEVEDPSQWRALDVITWKDGKSGHVILIRSVSEGEDGVWNLDTVESAVSTGPRRGKYTWSEAEGFNSYIPDHATVRRASMPDTAPVIEAAGGQA